MTPYFVVYAILVVAIGTGLLLDKLRAAAIIAFVPMFLLIALRGLVGTDSAVYVQIFDVIRYQGVLASSFEPGFTILVDLLCLVFKDPFDILIVLGCATALIMLAAGLLLERGPLLFLTVVLPYFVIDMSMNGLRYGLAFAIVALGAGALARGWLKAFIACCIVAASIQISSVLLAASLWALIEARIRTFLAAGVGLVFAFTLFGDYLEEKLSQNADISGIGGLSGVAPLLATVLIIVAMRLARTVPDPQAKVIDGAPLEPQHVIGRVVLLSILAMQFASFVIARQYYAGLRLQALFLFLLYIVIATAVARTDRKLLLNRGMVTLLLLSFAVLAGSRLKNFNDDVLFLSPYNPYYFASELSA